MIEELKRIDEQLRCPSEGIWLEEGTMANYVARMLTKAIGCEPHGEECYQLERIIEAIQEWYEVQIASLEEDLEEAGG